MPPKNMTKARFVFKAENGETWEEIKELTDAEVTSLKEELEEREEYVRVVRCKDCKCKDKYENFCHRFLREIDPSDYCSCAERREE